MQKLQIIPPVDGLILPDTMIKDTMEKDIVIADTEETNALIWDIMETDILAEDARHEVFNMFTYIRNKISLHCYYQQQSLWRIEQESSLIKSEHNK